MTETEELRALLKVQDLLYKQTVENILKEFDCVVLSFSQRSMAHSQRVERMTQEIELKDKRIRELQEENHRLQLGECKRRHTP